MKIEIDSDVSMPLVQQRATLYPWDEMETGQSFAHDKKVNVAQANKRYAPKRFKCLAHDGRFRVWRIA